MANSKTNCDNPNKSYRVSLVFGQNGTGKSTISNAIRESSRGNNYEGIEILEFVNSDGNEIARKQEILSKTHVFCESYVSENVQINDDGLGAIVALLLLVRITQPLRRGSKLWQQISNV